MLKLSGNNYKNVKMSCFLFSNRKTCVLNFVRKTNERKMSFCFLGTLDADQKFSHLWGFLVMLICVHSSGF
jgi:hypothetical protein